MRYKYYSTQRPIDIGTYPKLPDNPVIELVIYTHRQPVENGTAQAWGELHYSTPLSPQQIADYELRPSRDNPDVKERMSVQAQAVGAWEKRNRIPEVKRLTRWNADKRVYEPLDSIQMEQLQRQFEISVDFPDLSSHARCKPKKPPQRGGR